MLCPKCNTQNSDAARYCNGCGMPMSQGCSRCGASLAPGARFCEGCGTPAIAFVEKRSDPLTAPDTESLTTQTPPVYMGGLPYTGEATAPLAPWQWAIAIAGGA